MVTKVHGKLIFKFLSDLGFDKTVCTGQDYERTSISRSYLSIVQTGFQNEILAKACIYFMHNYFNLAVCTADVFFTKLKKL